MKYPRIKIGDRFGKWKIVAQGPNKGRRVAWICKCDCGVEKSIVRDVLVDGRSQSCGCRYKVKNGLAATSLGRIWYNMMSRCYNHINKEYKNYGARGIGVCEEWKSSNGMQQFIKDMSPRPNGKTLDRIDNNGNYSKENCRWASLKAQMSNRRSNRILEIYGKSQTLTQWSDETGISEATIRARIDELGWNTEKAISCMPRKYKMI